MASFCSMDGYGDYATSNYTMAVTGDLTVIAKIRAADWTPSVLKIIACQTDGATDRNWNFYLQTTGALVFSYSTDGTATVTKTSSAVLQTAASLTDNASDIWVKATHDVDNGAGGNDVKFWYSTDETTWTQLGTTQTTAGTVTRYNSTTAHRVGMMGSSWWASWAGRIYGVWAYSDLTETTCVLSPDFTTTPWSAGVTSGADAQGNTWTLTNAYIDWDQDWSRVVGQNRRFARR